MIRRQLSPKHKRERAHLSKSDYRNALLTLLRMQSAIRLSLFLEIRLWNESNEQVLTSQIKLWNRKTQFPQFANADLFLVMSLLIILPPKRCTTDDATAETYLQLLISAFEKAGLTIWQEHLVEDA